MKNLLIMALCTLLVSCSPNLTSNLPDVNFTATPQIIHDSLCDDARKIIEKYDGKNSYGNPRHFITLEGNDSYLITDEESKLIKLGDTYGDLLRCEVK